MTCHPLALQLGAATASAFWRGDDEYYVRVGGSDQADQSVEGWYRFDDEVVTGLAASPFDVECAERAARQMVDVIPMGGGRVAFPVGSTGRTVYRVWRTRGRRAGTDGNSCRTRILGVRAGRSLRRPA